VEIIDTDKMVERSKGTATSGETHQPSTSNTQLIERHLSVEVSSFTKLVDKEKDIKDRYKEIKLRNEKLKVETYAQYFKQMLEIILRGGVNQYYHINKTFSFPY